MVDRAAAFLDDIRAEPETLERLLDAYEAPNGPLAAVPEREPNRVRVLLAGLGSSRYAAVDAATSLRAAGVAAWTEIPGTVPPTPPAADLVVVAISASGRTSEVLEAAERHRGTSLVIAITNDPEGPLGASADVVLPLLAGTEASGIACRTWQATTVVLELLGQRLAGRHPDTEDLRPVAPALRELIQGRETWQDPATELLDRAPGIAVLAPGAMIGMAEQAALMLREAPRLPATAHETGEWLHTGIYTALPGYRAVLFAGSPRDGEVERTIRGRGGLTLTVGVPPEGSWWVGSVRVPGPALSSSGSRLVLGTIGELLGASLWSRTDAQLKGT